MKTIICDECMKDVKVIESTSRLNGEFEIIKVNGKKFQIIGTDLDFLNVLRDLPVNVRISLMCLTEEEILQYLSDKGKSAKEYLSLLLNKKWHWRETGDEVIIDEDSIEGFPFSQAQILKKLKSKKGFTNKQMNDLITWFVGDHAQVYDKENQ